MPMPFSHVTAPHGQLVLSRWGRASQPLTRNDRKFLRETRYPAKGVHVENATRQPIRLVGAFGQTIKVIPQINH